MQSYGYVCTSYIDCTGAEYIDDLTIPVQAYIGSLESNHIIYSTLYRFMNALMVSNSNADIYEREGKTHTQIVSGGLAEIDYAITGYFDTFKAKK